MSGTRLSLYRRALLVTCAALSVFCAACERATELTFEGSNPPKFKMRGSGELLFLRFRGPKKQREAVGETALLYWVIKAKTIDFSRSVESINTIIYGQVPEGYIQVYPENGDPPPALDENVKYTVMIDTANAPGVIKIFEIRNGRVEEIPDLPRPIGSPSDSKQ